jgi:hypothetical protein
MNQSTNVLILVLAVIGAIALVGVLGMWLMHGMMMGPSMMAGGFGVVIALVAFGVTAGLLLARTKPRP